MFAVLLLLLSVCAWRFDRKLYQDKCAGMDEEVRSEVDYLLSLGDTCDTVLEFLNEDEARPLPRGSELAASEPAEDSGKEIYRRYEDECIIRSMLQDVLRRLQAYGIEIPSEPDTEPIDD